MYCNATLGIYIYFKQLLYHDNNSIYTPTFKIKELDHNHHTLT